MQNNFHVILHKHKCQTKKAPCNNGAFFMPSAQNESAIPHAHKKSRLKLNQLSSSISVVEKYKDVLFNNRN